MTTSDCQKWIKETAAERIRHYTTRLNALHDLTDLRHADDHARQNYAGRFAFELLQNGADAHDKAVNKGLPDYVRGQGRVAFVLTENCLLVANTPRSRGLTAPTVFVR
jgi:hypothetical protein